MFNPLEDDGDLFLRLMQAEGALADAETQFQRLADALPYGIWTCGPDGELTHISQSFLDLIGMSLEECQQFGWWGKLAPEEVETTRAAWLHCLLNAMPYNREHTVAGTDGVRHTVLVRAVPIRDDQDHVSGWVGINLDIEDRKRAEAAVRESEKRFRTLADETPVLIWMTGTDGRAIYYNRQWQELTGVAGLEQKVGGWISILHTDDRDRAVETFRRAAERRTPYEMSYRIRAQDGSYRLLLERATPRFLEEGSFAGYVGSCTDVTELTEAKAHVAQVDEQFRCVSEALGAMVYDSELQSGKTQWYGMVEQVFGAAPARGEDRLTWWQTRVHPEDLERLYKAVYLAARTNGVFEAEYRFRLPDGTYAALLDRGICTTDESKQIQRVVGLVTRISTDRSVIPDEDELEKVRQIVDAFESPAFVLNTAHVAVHVNAGALALFNCERETFLSGWIKLVSREDRLEVMEQWTRAFKCGSKLSTEFRIGNEAVRRFVQLTLVPVRGTNGAPCAFIGILNELVDQSAESAQIASLGTANKS